jgi:hypothetical protein
LTLEGPHGEFVPLAAEGVEWLVRAIEYSRGLPASRRRHAILEREEKRGVDFEKYAFEVLDSQSAAFHGVPYVTVPGPKAEAGGRIQAWTNTANT